MEGNNQKPPTTHPAIFFGERPMQIAFQKITSNAFSPNYRYDDVGFKVYSAYEYHIPPGGRCYIMLDLRFRNPWGVYLRVSNQMCLALFYGVMAINDLIDTGGNCGILLLNTSTRPFFVFRGMHIANIVLEKYMVPKMVELPPDAPLKSSFCMNGEREFHDFLARMDFASGKNPIPSTNVNDDTEILEDEDYRYKEIWGSSWYTPKCPSTFCDMKSFKKWPAYQQFCLPLEPTLENCESDPDINRMKRQAKRNIYLSWDKPFMMSDEKSLSEWKRID